MSLAGEGGQSSHPLPAWLPARLHCLPFTLPPTLVFPLFPPPALTSDSHGSRCIVSGRQRHVEGNPLFPPRLDNNTSRSLCVRGRACVRVRRTRGRCIPADHTPAPPRTASPRLTWCATRPSSPVLSPPPCLHLLLSPGLLHPSITSTGTVRPSLPRSFSPFPPCLPLSPQRPMLPPSGKGAAAWTGAGTRVGEWVEFLTLPFVESPQ